MTTQGFERLNSLIATEFKRRLSSQLKQRLLLHPNGMVIRAFPSSTASSSRRQKLPQNLYSYTMSTPPQLSPSNYWPRRRPSDVLNRSESRGNAKAEKEGENRSKRRHGQVLYFIVACSKA